MANRDWSRDEVEATVADYFSMLREELAGGRPNKVRHNENLRPMLRDRSPGAVEFKHANISAILTLHGNPYINGYKPRFNFQALLEQAVLEYLEVHADFFEPVLDGPLLSPIAPTIPAPVDIDAIIVEPPEEMRFAPSQWKQTKRLTKIDFVARDAANKRLGRNGEEFVVELERRRLFDGGRRELVSRIEWTSQVRGDGAGYDIESFNLDGSVRLIEVKTTGLGKYFPFSVTANEVRCSDARPTQFHLYRLFDFGTEPKLYQLPGPLSASCKLEPLQYRAFVMGKVV